MQEPTFTKREVETVIKVLTDRLPDASASWDEITFHVGRNTKVLIKFSGPLGINELDALLAHIAYYKTFFKKDAPTNDLPTLQSIRKAIIDELLNMANERIAATKSTAES